MANGGEPDAANLPTQTIPSVDSTTNRLQGTPNTHDAAGNLTWDPITGNTFTYDGENKQVTATVGPNTSNYTYDGDGRRVQKLSGGVTTIYVYNVSGELIAEYNNSGQPPVGGGGTSYLTIDHLGSTRVVTNSSGGVKSRHDYMPFGEEIGGLVSTRSTIDSKYDVDEGIKQKFTSKERDPETGLDFFEARYYNSGHGRFTSPDDFSGGPRDLFDSAGGTGRKRETKGAPCSA